MCSVPLEGALQRLKKDGGCCTHEELFRLLPSQDFVVN